jgi:hypothetical protein
MVSKEETRTSTVAFVVAGGGRINGSIMDSQWLGGGFCDQEH